MCIRIWGDLLRRLISLPGERPTPRRASRPRASVGSRQDRYSADDEADAYAAEGAAATHLDDRDTPPQRPVPPFAPEHLHVRFTQRAWVSLLSETLYKVATETGGILLGYRDGDDWLVAESIDPGPNSVFELAFFEYDQPYVNHLANRIVRLYERPLEVIGLWHRHPGSFDRFSNTDDGTNARYAQLSPWGSLSGLVNIDPEPRLTLFHVDGQTCGYTRVPFTVLTWEESLAQAPLCAPDALMRRLAAQNERALHAGAAPAPAAPALSLTELAELWEDAVSRQASHDRPVFDGAEPVWDTALWTDDELAQAVHITEADGTALAARGVELELSLDREQRLRLVATDGHAERVLGVIGKLPQADGSATFALSLPAADATMLLRTGAITRALDAHGAPHPACVTVS